MRDPNAAAAEAGKVPPESIGSSVAGFVVAVIVIVCGMVVFYYYPWPSGGRPTLGEFVAFWFRELLLLGAVIAVVIVVAISRIARALRSRKHAP